MKGIYDSKGGDNLPVIKTIPSLREKGIGEEKTSAIIKDRLTMLNKESLEAVCP